MMGAANKLRDLFAKKPGAQESDNSVNEKARIEQLRKALQEKIKKDPKLAKKAAMIVEEMLKKQFNK